MELEEAGNDREKIKKHLDKVEFEQTRKIDFDEHMQVGTTPKRRKIMLNERWVPYESVKAEDQGNGVVRRVLAYSKDLMCVENTFEKGAVGALHQHPHTQITYVVSGVFEFEIEGEKRVVKAGDTMLKTDSVEHGCVCLEAGVLLDIFNPMRDDFV